eukprot:CAMPEP_0172479004 /NCGR_PEP_ID=MMETSP1066-20121228/3268_1 /TAXON_ID=671091 /ORGANISM="Coscinodiscus wailesii, Strain CCMP2513" /LENGTH=248 /DNA_ID=CAMNT_0013239037 /DNA_START=59 /DNA_END=805 /DNA_ORIENTATION=+
MTLHSTLRLTSPLLSKVMTSPARVIRPVSSQASNSISNVVKPRGVRTYAKESTPSKVPESLPLSAKDMSADNLALLSALDQADAIEEMLKRHIMSVDSVDYEKATKIFGEIRAANREGMYITTIPYKAGIYTALGASALSFPLCFHYPTVHWFNDKFVTSDIPEPKDLETWLEVGSWAWCWMEPVMGQVSFVLLCLQFARAQIQNIGIRPFTDALATKRASSLATKFSKYDSGLIQKYSKVNSRYYDE